MLRRIAEALTLAPHELLDDSATGLSRLRTTAGLSQSELAAAAGIARSTYSAIERGAIAALDPHTAEKIATALHVTPIAVLDAHANTKT